MTFVSSILLPVLHEDCDIAAVCIPLYVIASAISTTALIICCRMLNCIAFNESLSRACALGAFRAVSGVITIILLHGVVLPINLGYAHCSMASSLPTVRVLVIINIVPVQKRATVCVI